MIQYNRLNVKLSNSQLNKLKSAIKNKSELVLRLSPNMIGESNDESNNESNNLIIHQLILNFQKLNYQKWYN